MAHASTHTMAGEMQECINACLQCHSVCLLTAQHCLELGGKHADPSHITLLLDCAEICRTSANFMLRGSALRDRTCAVCAEVCRACAESCERMGSGDRQMRQCAESCRRCEQSCERMAAA